MGQEARLCSSRTPWPLLPNVCPCATRKPQIFYTNLMLGTLDFTVSEPWAPFIFPSSTALGRQLYQLKQQIDGILRNK